MDAPRTTKDRAKDLRRRMNLPEVLLWKAIKGRRLQGLHFRKQHPLGPYVLDFYCEAGRLAVEVDGASHSLGDRPQRDERRDAWLRAEGITT
jgi:very-short-patch-repair endonuclease